MHDDDAVVSRVCNNKVAHVVNSNALGTHKLSVPRTLATENTSGGTIGVYHEDMVNVEIRHNYVSIIVKGYSSWGIKVPTQVAFIAKLSQQNAVVIEDEETMVSCVCDSNAAVHVVHCDVIRVDHLSIITTL